MNAGTHENFIFIPVIPFEGTAFGHTIKKFKIKIHHQISRKKRSHPFSHRTCKNRVLPWHPWGTEPLWIPKPGAPQGPAHRDLVEWTQVALRAEGAPIRAGSIWGSETCRWQNVSSDTLFLSGENLPSVLEVIPVGFVGLKKEENKKLGFIFEAQQSHSSRPRMLKKF